MHGNVWEWCLDRYGAAWYAESPREDPRGPGLGAYRVLRGRSWMSAAHNCRSAKRIRYAPDARYADVGFRVVCETGE
jgi:formylglycine-generating enzyme required for sulfatase activity